MIDRNDVNTHTNAILAVIVIAVLAFGVAIGFVVNEATSDEEDTAAPVDQANLLGGPLTFAGEFGAPSAPQQIYNNSAFAHYDVQIHNRDNPNTWDATMNAEHGNDCSGPPNTHSVSALPDGVYICSDHVMTAMWSMGYGEIILTPTQILNCSATCTVKWDISTAEQSSRDWWTVDLTPWADNITLPFDGLDVDNQGPQKNGISIDTAPGNGAPRLNVYENGSRTLNAQSCVWTGAECAPTGAFIVDGTNQAAKRQTFSLTLNEGHVKFERLASLTATAIVYFDIDAPFHSRNDYIVQFGHHSYNPTKDNAGSPQSWHWANFVLSPSSPFTLVHAQERVIQGNLATTGTVHFNSPAPANAFLRFSAVCRVKTDANGLDASGQKILAPKQAFLTHPEHVSPYFIPIAKGKTSVDISFAPDDWYNGFPCWAQDFHIWSKDTGVSPTPTPVPVTPTPTPIPPTATPVVNTPVPTFTPPVPTATAKPGTTPTKTPTPVKKSCGLRWGTNLLESYGTLSQQDCANRGN